MNILLNLLIYFIESFNIFNEYSELIYDFYMPIYKDIVNHIYYDTRNKQLSTIELIIFGKNFIPLNLKYDSYDLDKLDSNNNRHRIRACLVNIDPYKIQYLNDINFKKKNFEFKNKSYQIIIRIPENSNKFQYSLSLIKIKNLNNFLYSGDEVKKINNNNIDINEIKKFCSDYNIFSSVLNEAITYEYLKDYNDENDLGLSEDLQHLITLYENIKINDLYVYLFESNNFINTSSSLELIHYNYFLMEFKSIINNIASENLFKKFIEYNNFSLDNYEIEKYLYSKLLKDNQINKEEEKIKILQTCSDILVKTTLSKNKIINIDYIKIENLEKNSPNNPYNKAIKLINDIIDNLNEDSRLFEAFLYFNSGTINNLLEKNEKKIKYNTSNNFGETIYSELEEYITEFGLSLLNLDQIKKHLKNLIPKLIIRVETNVKFRAFYDDKTNIMIINESTLFKESIENLNIFYKGNSEKYVIPITMEIFHEMLSHGKIRYYDDEELTPRFYRDSKNNYEFKNISKICKTLDNNYLSVPVPESGRILESFISENNYVIEHLKMPELDNIKFINYKYWISSNFDYISNEILKNQNIDSSNSKKMNIDEIYIDDTEDCYINRIGKKYK